MILTFGLFYLIFRRGLLFLQIAQQDEYSSERLFLWYKEKSAYDTKVTLSVIFGLFLSIFVNKDLVILLITLYLVYLAIKTIDPRNQAKLKLILTVRAKKVLYLFLFINFIICLFISFLEFYTLLISTLLIIQLIPFSLMLTLLILEPFETNLQEKFFYQAQTIFKKYQPFTIGVTGSYGKTSVKNGLAELMQSCLGSTFYPPEGINTKMGITRHIRENLNQRFKYAVIEMAAYRLGSIATLCELTPPKIGIITAIGKQHLERFGDEETIYQAKTELARSLPDDGILIVNSDCKNARRAGFQFKKSKNIFYGLDEADNLDYFATNIKYTFEGSEFDIISKTNTFHVKTKLLGKAAISNLLSIFAAGIELGIKEDLIIGQFANLKPVNNRLALEKYGEIAYLQDGYNSNEKGFVLALEVLAKLPAKQRIIMTPGVVELAEQQFELNNQLANLASDICDFVIVVGNVNKDAFVLGVKNNKLISVPTREEGFKKLEELAVPQTIILIENDLSDYYEAEYKF